MLCQIAGAVPFVHFFDGFRTSHEIQKIDDISDDDIKKIYPYNKLAEFKNSGRIAYIGVAYGSRREIVCAINKAIEKGEMVTEEGFLSCLDAPINLDLVIRTGGEQRLSNFMLYQSSYAELYFSDKYFPDFTPEDMDEAFAWYDGRKRRFGKI